MPRYFLLLLLYALLSAQSCTMSHSETMDKILSAQTFMEKIKENPSALILDVRTPAEFVKGHLQNATNLDWNGNQFQSEVAKMDKAIPVFVYCLSGVRSASAARNMRKQGFKEVYELEGGLLTWRADNLPETKNPSFDSEGMTKAQFDSLLQDDKMVLVDFYADWCAPCKKMKPYLEEIATTMADQVTLIRINADDNQKLLKEQHIVSIPVLQLYKNDSLAWTHSGYISRKDLMKILH